MAEEPPTSLGENEPAPAPKGAERPVRGEDPPTPGSEAPAEAPPKNWETEYRYLLAEFDNFRKRAARDRDSLDRGARAQVLRSIFPMLEATRSAEAAAQRLPASNPLRRGVELLVKEWETFLDREQVTPVAKPSDPFRPDDHEAVAETTATDSRPEGTVVEVIQQGYRFPGGLLRPAKVMVARRPHAEESTPVEAAAEAGSKGTR